MKNSPGQLQNVSDSKLAVASVLGFLHSRCQQFAARPALCVKEADGWRELTYGDLAQRAKSLASCLIELGLQLGDRVAILSESKPEWGICFFAGVRSGATMVPLDIKLTQAELTNILSDCQPKVVFVDSKHKEVIDSVAEKVKSIEHIFLVESGGDELHQSIALLQPQAIQEGVDRQLDEVAVLVYTSGTTGNPKGVMTTYGNLIFQVQSFKEVIDLTEEDRFLSILPLNHLLELTGGFLGVLNQGGMVSFCHSLFPQEIIRSLRDRQITGLVGVPLFFKSLKGGIEREIRRKGEEEVQRFAAALVKAEDLPLSERAKLFAPVHEQLGGKVRVFICGGAPLELEVAQFFQRLGIPILQGYGLTETSPVIAGNRLDANRLGSVGPALKGVEVKIDLKDPGDTEGEILTRGPHVMHGYYKRPEQTQEIVDSGGWLHTGDIGHLDDDGFLFITGRIKNLIVLGGGKKVFPEEVEAALSAGETIKEICIIGSKSADGFKEGTEEVAAVVVPADALVHEHKGNADLVEQAVKKEIDLLNQNLAAYKRPTRIFFHADELPKTATRKVKRNLVAEWMKGACQQGRQES